MPESFPYEEARRLFKEPDVLHKEAVPELKWTAPNSGAAAGSWAEPHACMAARLC